ncbi:MAG: type II secretion system F family protein [bacterium]
MNFKYQAVSDKGEKKNGVVEAINKDAAITALQRRGLVVVGLAPEDEKKGLASISFFAGTVPMKDVVIASRQISTLFEAQVSALKAFSLMATNAENKTLAKAFETIVSDLQAGSSISGALEKHPKIFSAFYVSMIKSGEESGKLTQTFAYLAEYLDRQYALSKKIKNALIYPAFVVGIFFTVMTLMLVIVIPKLSKIILDSGQVVPWYTKMVMFASDMLVHYGIFVLIIIVAFVGYVIYLSRSETGKAFLDRTKIAVPVFGPLFRKMYLARLADNMDTMLSSGIPIVRAIEITADIVDNQTYHDILRQSAEKVKGGVTFSDSLEGNPEIPQVLTQMIKVGEESGAMGSILKTLAKFYKREVDDAVDTMVGLIEPLMIVGLGLGVGTLLVSVLMPIYNIAGGIN